MQEAPRTEARTVPQTRTQLEAMYQSRAELKEQLASTNQLRANLRGQIANTDGGPARAELQGRLTALDARIGRLESQLLGADDAIANALAQGVGVGSADIATSAAPPTPAPAPTPVPGFPGQSTTIPDHEFHDVISPMEDAVAAGAVAVVLSFIVISTFFYKMARRKSRQMFEALAADQARRFDQLQQAVDVIAVETERVSEAQRFVSKRINEMDPALGAGQAQPVSPLRHAAEPIRRDR